MKSNPVCAEAVACTFYHCRLSLLAFTDNILVLSFVSPYNHLLFLAKTNKENDNNIDFSLSIGQNLKKYSSILD
jgi:hypothetical protein